MRIISEFDRRGMVLRRVNAEKSIKHLRVHRGEIWMADLGEGNVLGSEQRGFRPVLIIQNDVGNKYSPTTIVACITNKEKTDIPTHIKCELYELSTIMLEQIKTISKQRLRRKVRTLTPEEMREVDKRLMISLGI